MTPDELAYLYKKTFVGYFFPCLRDHGYGGKCHASLSTGSIPYFNDEKREYKIKLREKQREGIQQFWRGRNYRFRLVTFEKYIRTKNLPYLRGANEEYFDELRESRANLRLRNSIVADLYYSKHGFKMEGEEWADQFYVQLLVAGPELLSGKTLFRHEGRGLSIFRSQVKNYDEVHEYVYHFSGVPIEFVYFYSDSFSQGYYSKKDVIDNKVTFYLLRSLYKVGWTLIHVHFTIINYWRKLQLLGFCVLMRRRIRWNKKKRDCFARIGGLPRESCFVLRLPMDLYRKVIEYF